MYRSYDIVLGNRGREILRNQTVVSNSEFIYILFFPEDLIIICDKVN